MAGAFAMNRQLAFEASARERARLAALTNDKASRDRLLSKACRYMESAAHERLARAVAPVNRPLPDVVRRQARP